MVIQEADGKLQNRTCQRKKLVYVAGSLKRVQRPAEKGD
jgi:hypothetical protein